MVIKEWRCAACGDFESADAACPTCGRPATRVFKTAPAVRSVRTANTDTLMQRLADENGLTDIRNDKGTVARSIHRSTPSERPDLDHVAKERFNDLVARRIPAARKSEGVTKTIPFTEAGVNRHKLQPSERIYHPDDKK